MVFSCSRRILGGLILAALLVGGDATAFADAVGEEPEGWRRQWRQHWLDDESASRYGLKLDESGGAESLIVVLHGYNSTPTGVAELMRPIREARLWCGEFAYPNDQPLADSAKLLSVELRRLAERDPAVQVTLVTHSMGGLVARAAIEDLALDPGNVHRLIMIAPPTHGSGLARVAVATDLWEHWLSRRTGGFRERLRDSIVDGLGEAATDLRPNSKFLLELNSRGRHPGVTYTLIIGVGGSISSKPVDWLRARARGVASVERWLNEFEEVLEGRGDGIVALERARLDGVDDVVTLPFGHLDIVGAQPSEAALEARTEMLDRLGISHDYRDAPTAPTSPPAAISKTMARASASG